MRISASAIGPGQHSDVVSWVLRRGNIQSYHFASSFTEKPVTGDTNSIEVWKTFSSSRIKLNDIWSVFTLIKSFQSLTHEFYSVCSERSLNVWCSSEHRTNTCSLQSVANWKLQVQSNWRTEQFLTINTWPSLTTRQNTQKRFKTFLSKEYKRWTVTLCRRNQAPHRMPVQLLQLLQQQKHQYLQPHHHHHHHRRRRHQLL